MKHASIATGLALAALSAVSTTQAAEPIYQNLAGITHAANGAEEAAVNRGATGVSNSSAAAIDVVITPPRRRIDEGTSAATALTVRISLSKSAVTPAAVTCVAEVRNQNGGVTISRNIPGVGANTISANISRSVTFTNTEVGGGYGSVVITCSLPGGNLVTLKDARAF